MREDWIECELEEVCEIITGNTPSKANSLFYSNKNFPFYKPTDLDAGDNVCFSNDGLSDEGFKNSRIAPEGSILVTCIGATIGKTGLIKKSGAFNQQINCIFPDKNIDTKFLYFQVIGLKFQQKIKENASSTTLPILNKSKFSILEINIAPLPIQRAIVSKIEALFSDLDNGIANFKKAQEQLKIYRQAVLKKAFEGELTKEWREKQTNLPTAEELLKQIKEERQNHYNQQIEDWKKAVKEWEKGGSIGKKPSKPTEPKELPTLKKEELEELPNLPDSWVWMKLGNFTIKLSDGPFGSNLKTEDYVESGVRVIRLENIKNLFFDVSKKSYITVEKYNTISNHTAYAGDIIFSTFIADEIKVAIVPSNIDYAVNKADCICISPYNSVSNRLVH